MKMILQAIARLQAWDELTGASPKGWRSVTTKAGGIAFLKSLDRKQAEALLNKALKEVLKENDERSRPKNLTVDKSSITDWADDVFGVPAKGDKWDTDKARAGMKKAPANRKSWPAHLQKRVPPGWKNVRINPDPAAAIQAEGEDRHGRYVRLPNTAYQRSQSAAKYRRLTAFQNSKKQMYTQVAADLKSKDPEVKDNAAIVRLMQATGMRPGSVNPSKQSKNRTTAGETYGAITLEGRHISQNSKGEVQITFVGKKNVKITLTVENPVVAKDLLARKNKSGRTGELFPNTEYRSVGRYFRKLPGNSEKKNFIPYDMRTDKATTEAIAMIKKLGKPKNMDEMAEYIDKVGRHVGSKLGNKADEAVQSYISPSVWEPWLKGIK